MKFILMLCVFLSATVSAQERKAYAQDPQNFWAIDMTVTGMLVRYGLPRFIVWMGCGTYSMRVDVSTKVLIGNREQQFLSRSMALLVHTWHMMISHCSPETEDEL